VSVLLPFVGGIYTRLLFLMFPSRQPAGSLFGAHFDGVGVTVLCDNCDSCDLSEDDDSLLLCE
jgi:hypothetical protein